MMPVGRWKFCDAQYVIIFIQVTSRQADVHIKRYKFVERKMLFVADDHLFKYIFDINKSYVFDDQNS